VCGRSSTRTAFIASTYCPYCKFPADVTVKAFKNRSVFDEVMPEILQTLFFPDTVYKLIYDNTRYRFLSNVWYWMSSKPDLSFFCDRTSWNSFIYLLYSIFAAMSTTIKSIKQNKQLSAHSVSMKIFIGIARFPCDSTISCAPWLPVF